MATSIRHPRSLSITFRADLLYFSVILVPPFTASSSAVVRSAVSRSGALVVFASSFCFLILAIADLRCVTAGRTRPRVGFGTSSQDIENDFIRIAALFHGPGNGLFDLRCAEAQQVRFKSFAEVSACIGEVALLPKTDVIGPAVRGRRPRPRAFSSEVNLSPVPIQSKRKRLWVLHRRAALQFTERRPERHMAGEFVEQAFERLALRLRQAGKHVALALAQRRNVLRIERAAGRCDEQNLAPVVGAVGFAAQQLFLLERDDPAADIRLEVAGISQMSLAVTPSRKFRKISVTISGRVRPNSISIFRNEGSR